MTSFDDVLGAAVAQTGYVFSGDGELVRARVVQAPWLTRLRPRGEDVAVVLETPCRTVRIDGETVLSTYDVHHDDKMFSSQALRQEMAGFPVLQQAGVRYRWDDEEAFGMLERSSPQDKITHP